MRPSYDGNLNFFIIFFRTKQSLGNNRGGGMLRGSSLVSWASKLSGWRAIVSMQLQAFMMRVSRGTGQSSWKSRTGRLHKVEFVHEDGRFNVDAYCLAKSCVNFLVGRYVWFAALPNRVCTSYPKK